MVSRFSQSSVSLVSNHRYDEDCVSSHDDGDSRRKDSEAKSSSSYGNGTTEGAATATSMAYLPQTIVLCELRHDASEASAPLGTSEIVLVPKWRLKERMKTGCVALVLCLNITVDPPDVIKISPCARIEAWIDPFSMAPPKALETIGKKFEHSV